MHPYRHALHDEVHARPSMYFDVPAQVFHLAFLDDGETAQKIVESLCQRHIAVADPSRPQGQFAIGNASLRWERHTEFLTLTLVTSCAVGAGWLPLPPALAAIAQRYNTQLINADQLHVEHESSWRGETQAYGFRDPVGSTVADGKARVWSDLRLNDTGLNRILLVNQSLDRRQLGRMVRRLLEIETYRLMASLALPIARQLSTELRAYETELVTLSDANANAESEDIKPLLEHITRLSARVTQTSTRHRSRFDATEAYAQLVFERVDQLRESRVGDCQRFGTFITQRFHPTVRYCKSTDRRLARISSAVVHLGNLLQARVQVEMEEQNGHILRSLSTRAETQIKIQRAVEGLSIIALSYYLLELFKLIYEGVVSLGVEVPSRTAIIVAAPLAIVILGAVAYRIVRVRRH